MTLRVDVAAILLVLMFILSGVNKVLSFGSSEALRFAAKTGLDERLSGRIVFLAGAWELAASALILYGVWVLSGKRALEAVTMGTNALILFTVLATLIFYANPMRGIWKLHPVLANLTAIAGLLLLPRVCSLRHGAK